MLSTNPMLARVIKSSADKSEISKINKYFEEIQHVTEASDIYLLNSQGDAIAASNWQQAYSFIGQNYAFRPYYTEAIAGRWQLLRRRHLVQHQGVLFLLPDLRSG